MLAARLIKTPDEIAVIEEACAIGDSVTQRAIDETQAGRRENEIAGDAMQTLFYLGGEMAHVITPYVASGEHMSRRTGSARTRSSATATCCFIDIGAMWNGYFADIGRTTIVGKPTHMQKRIYTAVYEALMAGRRDQMRPGNTNQDAADAIIAKVAEHGFGEQPLQPVHRPWHRHRAQRTSVHRGDASRLDRHRAETGHGVRDRTARLGARRPGRRRRPDRGHGPGDGGRSSDPVPRGVRGTFALVMTPGGG